MLDLMAVLAQVTEGAGLIGLGIGLGFGITVIGAAIGIGYIGGSAVNSIARQPEATGPIGTNMIIAAALIEGLAVISMVLLAFVVGG